MARTTPALALALTLALTATPAYAATRTAAPNGSGTACTVAAPCSVEQAFSGANSGDAIELTGGTYTATASLADLGKSLVVRPRPGTGSVHIDSSAPGVAMAMRGDTSVVRDLSIRSIAETAQPTLSIVDRAEARRLRVESAATGKIAACNVGLGTQDRPATLVDVACINRSVDGGSAITQVLPFSGHVRLVRVTARVLNATAAPNNGFVTSAQDGQTVVARIEDSILEGRVADVAAGEAGTGSVVVTLTRTNFSSTATLSGTPTFGDGGGNQTAAPVWNPADPARPAGTSPTIDAGSTAGDGLPDLLGSLRYAGTSGDMGAIEHLPPAQVGAVTVTGVTQTSATVSAPVNTGRVAGVAGRFAFGPGSLSLATSELPLARQAAPQTMTATLLGLAPGTTYSVAGQAGGVTGSTATFTTASEPAAPPPAAQIPRLSRISIAAVRRGRVGRLRITSDVPAAVRVRVERARAGRRSGRRCTATGRGRRCTRYVRVRTVRGNLVAGANTLRIRASAAGAYRLVIRATNEAGTRQRTVRWRVR